MAITSTFSEETKIATPTAVSEIPMDQKQSIEPSDDKKRCRRRAVIGITTGVVVGAVVLGPVGAVVGGVVGGTIAKRRNKCSAKRNAAAAREEGLVTPLIAPSAPEESTDNKVAAYRAVIS